MFVWLACFAQKRSCMYECARQGVKWVYPSPDNHDPESYFKVGAILLWCTPTYPNTHARVRAHTHGRCETSPNGTRNTTWRAHTIRYEFKSSSTKIEVMSRELFCGHRPGPSVHLATRACAHHCAPAHTPTFEFFLEPHWTVARSSRSMPRAATTSRSSPSSARTRRRWCSGR